MRIEAGVVMIPTDDASFISLNTNENILSVDVNNDCSLNVFMENQHLYIITDDIIKQGDWYLCIKTNIIRKYTDVSCLIKYDKKIIYTDDVRVPVSAIPDMFITEYIKQYNNKNVINDVIVSIGKECTKCGAYQLETFQYCRYPRGGDKCCGGELKEKIEIKFNNEKPKTMEYKISKPIDFAPNYDETHIIELIEKEIKKYDRNMIIEDAFIHIFIPSNYISKELIDNVSRIYNEHWKSVNFTKSSDSDKYSIHLFLNK